MSPPDRRAVVVFDLDGTLVAGVSFGAFLRHLLTRQPARLAAALLTAGLEDVEVVASELRRTRWGLPAPAVPARGEGKAQALRAAGVPIPVDHACSDSASDLPLLRAARVRHLVDPSRGLARVRVAPGPDVEVLRWARRRT